LIKSIKANSLFGLDKVRRTNAARLIQKKWIQRRRSSSAHSRSEAVPEEKTGDMTWSAEHVALRNFIVDRALSYAFYPQPEAAPPPNELNSAAAVVGLADLHHRIKFQCEQKVVDRFDD
jgi:hypothetical protein